MYCHLLFFRSLFCLVLNLEEQQVHRDVELQLNGDKLGWIAVGCLLIIITSHKKQLKPTCYALSVAYLSVGSLSSNSAALRRHFATSLWVLRPRRTLLITHHRVYTLILILCESLSFAGHVVRRASWD